MDLNGLLNLCARDGMAVTTDSRKVESGGIFVACRGVNADGADFIDSAIANGARHIVCNNETLRNCRKSDGVSYTGCADPREALWRLAKARWSGRGFPGRIIGITGTNGKTTTAALLEHIFASNGKSTGVLGTIEYRWPGHKIPAPLTTPDPVALHEMLAGMAVAKVDCAIMEVSSHSLDQRRVDGVPFTGAVFTNLTQDHLDYHGNMENYFRAKARLFTDAPNAPEMQAINNDDAWGRRLLELLPHAVSYGLHPAPGRKRHLLGEELASGIHGIRLKLNYAGETCELQSPLVGRFNTFNLLAAQAMALQMGITPAGLACLEDFHGVCGRLERIRNDRGLHVFVDYAHTPDALENALAALRGSGFRRIITVFGCGGNRDRGKRPLMGRAVARNSDVAILTSDNPRLEQPEAIMRDVEPGLAEARECHMEVDRRKATELGLELAGPEDAVLIAGKGHEDYQIIGAERRHYSDQEAVREILNCG